MISFEKIKLNFGNEDVFQDFSIEIKKGEKICFWGPSGSGKTSLLRMLLGLVIPESGKIRINNMVLNPSNIMEIRKLLAWVPQNINLPADNGNDLASLLRLDQNQIEKFREIIKKMKLENKSFDKNFHEISIGQKQRIIIASTIASGKEILLLDEPTSALDEESTNTLIDIILKNEELTVISASHDEKWSKAHDKTIKINL